MPSLAREPKPRCLRWLLLEKLGHVGRERERGGERREDGTKVKEGKKGNGEGARRVKGGERRGERGAPDKRKVQEVLERGKWKMRGGREGGDDLFFAEEVEDAEGYWDNKNDEIGGK